MHRLWFYKHQHDNRVRSVCQRWLFQWRFWFVPSVPGYKCTLSLETVHTTFEWNCRMVVVIPILVRNCRWTIVPWQSFWITLYSFFTTLCWYRTTGHLRHERACVDTDENTVGACGRTAWRFVLILFLTHTYNLFLSMMLKMASHCSPHPPPPPIQKIPPLSDISLKTENKFARI